MTLGRAALLAGWGLGVMAANVAMTVLYMVVYSYAIDPGHDKAYYDAHVTVAAPYCSIVAGIPLMFAVGLWVESPLIVWLAYAVIDLAIVAVSGLTASALTVRFGVLVAISLLTKLAAAYCGYMLAAR